jgi:hypothetical protein
MCVHVRLHVRGRVCVCRQWRACACVWGRALSGLSSRGGLILWWALCAALQCLPVHTAP